MIGLKRVAKTFRTLNFTRLLGSVLLSSIPDLGLIVMEAGLIRTFGTLVGDLGHGFKGIRMAKDEIQLAGGALDITLSTRVRAMFDTGDRFLTETSFERNIDTFGQKFGNLTLLNHWNTVLKSMTSVGPGNCSRSV